MGRATAPADADRGRPDARLHLAAAGVPAPGFAAGFTRPRRDRNAMQTPMIRLAMALAALSMSSATANADTVFVSNEQDNTVSVIDGNALKVIDTIAVGRRP